MERAHRERRGGGIGWALLAAGVVAWDLGAPETLTNAFKRGTENERTRPFVIGALAVTAAHLMGYIPRELDPFYLVIDHGPLHADKGDTLFDDFVEHPVQ